MNMFSKSDGSDCAMMSSSYAAAKAYDYSRSTRELHSRYMREALIQRKSCKDRAEVFVHYLRRFADEERLSGSELEKLEELLRLCHAIRKMDREAVSKIKSIYDGLLVSSASPLAVAIAGVAVSSAQLAAVNNPSAAGTWLADVEGGIAGGHVGSHFGPWAAVGGVVLGGGAASLIANWEDDHD